MPSDLQPVPRYVAGMRIFVSLLLLGAGWMILTAPNFAVPHKPDDGLQKAAIGWIGAVIGYWLA
jgi:hypothetical protein